jgi:hypothetical protein
MPILNLFQKRPCCLANKKSGVGSSTTPAPPHAHCRRARLHMPAKTGDGRPWPDSCKVGQPFHPISGMIGLYLLPSRCPGTALYFPWPCRLAKALLTLPQGSLSRDPGEHRKGSPGVSPKTLRHSLLGSQPLMTILDPPTFLNRSMRHQGRPF